jgi:hypothetical protein
MGSGQEKESILRVCCPFPKYIKWTVKIMKQYRLLTTLLSLVLLACLSGVEGQYIVPQQGEVLGQVTPYLTETVGYPTTTQISQAGQTSQYYYTMGTPPNTHITAPQQFIMEGNTPTTVYFGYQQHPVAYSQYQSSLTYNKGDTLWIKGLDSWTQHAQVPLGALVTLLAMSPNGGSGYISDTHPNGRTYTFNYFFYPNSQLTFYADTPGRHTLTFGIPGDPSPPVTIDVMGSYNPPTFYNPPILYPYLGWGGFFGEGIGGFGEGEMHEHRGEHGGEGHGEEGHSGAGGRR